MSPHKQLENGVRFLLRHQDLDGAWRDFQLRPGRSDAWTTAFIGLRLASCARGNSRGPVRRALLAAAEFLQTAREPHGGWAYNWRCPADADSTACVILFLNTLSATVEPKDYAALARFQLAEGGFATYRFGNAGHDWCKAHPEVTATALRALAQFLPADHFRIQSGLRWLTDHAARACAPYWWLSPHYLAIEMERLRRIIPSAPRIAPEDGEHPERCFGVALKLEGAVLNLSDGPKRELSSRLLKHQMDDGGWPCSGILRIPDPHGKAAGFVTAIDDRRLMTTAAAISALRAARWRHHAMRRGWQPAEALSLPA